MVATNFPKALKFVLKSEGGNDDDPVDRGGRTSRGIIQREYNAWRAEQGKVSRDVWEASDEEIATIYHDEYWNPYCDKLPVGVDYDFFDMAVNHGPHRAIVLTQRALGVVDDGRIGPITRNAIASADPKKLINNIDEARRQYYKDIVASKPAQKKFLDGWMNRAAFVKRNALSMIGATT
jgi:lysozyme family protein